MSVILVGVVHKDPDGYGRLSGLLESLRPEAISVELSPLGLIWREERGQGLLRLLDSMVQGLPFQGHLSGHLDLLREGLRVPFEFTASLAYSQRNGIPLHLLDLNWVSVQHLPLYESELLTEENLMLLSELPSEPVRVAVKRSYLRAARCLARGVGGLDREATVWGDVTARRRERLLACRLRRLAKRHGTVAHVGGWVHLMHDPEGLTLASLLRDLDPRRVLLEGGQGPLTLS